MHRIRLRPFASSHKLPDISVPPKDFQHDTEVTIKHDDLSARAGQELYQERPTQPEKIQPPEPELIPSTPETDKATTHPSPSSPDLIHEPESISNYPGNQALDPTINITDELENKAPVPKSPRKSHYNLRKNPTFLETRLCILQRPRSQFSKPGESKQKPGRWPKYRFWRTSAQSAA